MILWATLSGSVVAHVVEFTDEPWYPGRTTPRGKCWRPKCGSQGHISAGATESWRMVHSTDDEWPTVRWCRRCQKQARSWQRAAELIGLLS